MWSERLAPAYFSKGPGVAFAIRGQHRDFRRERIRRPLLESAPRRPAPVCSCFISRADCSALTRGFWVVLALNVTPDFQHRLVCHDDRSAFDLLLDGGMFTFWLASEKSPQFSWYWPLTGLAHRPRISLQIHECAAARFPLCSCSRSCRGCGGNSSGPAFTCCWPCFAALHDAAHHLERTTLLDHARPPAIARQPRSGLRFSPGRTAHLSRLAFCGLFAAAFRWAWLGP